MICARLEEEHHVVLRVAGCFYRVHLEVSVKYINDLRVIKETVALWNPFIPTRDYLQAWVTSRELIVMPRVIPMLVRRKHTLDPRPRD